MSDWSAGYVSELGYTYGYYPELNPNRVPLALLVRGIAPPKIQTALELGFGQGVSINVHSAASDVDWWGTDFNPAQASFAKSVAGKSCVDAKLFDDAFAEFALREDLPKFDYIGLHGVWSWVSDANRQAILEIIRKNLAIGGVVYTSYNTLPGWSGFAPMRHLLTEHAQHLSSDGAGMINRIDGALAFATSLLETNPRYINVHPATRDRLDGIQQQNRHYLAHEFFNRDWHPAYFASVADAMSEAKLSFACGANYLDFIDSINLSEEQRDFITAIPDAGFKESTRDFMVNQQFRRDYWIKGAQRLTPLEQIEAIRAQRIVLAVHREKVSMTVTGALGDASLNEEIYGPVLDCLADYAVKSIGQLEEELSSRAKNDQSGFDFSQLLQAVLALVGSGQVHCAQLDTVTSHAAERSEKLNIVLCNKARSANDIPFLSSPVTGGGLLVDRFEQMFVAGMKHGATTSEALAQGVWDILDAQGQKIVQDGNRLDSTEDNLKDLVERAETFLAFRVPVLTALKVI